MQSEGRQKAVTAEQRGGRWPFIKEFKEFHRCKHVV